MNVTPIAAIFNTSIISHNSVVSVHPMNLPSGSVFYFDFKHGTKAPAVYTDEQKIRVLSKLRIAQQYLKEKSYVSADGIVIISGRVSQSYSMFNGIFNTRNAVDTVDWIIKSVKESEYVLNMRDVDYLNEITKGYRNGILEQP